MNSFRLSKRSPPSRSVWCCSHAPFKPSDWHSVRRLDRDRCRRRCDTRDCSVRRTGQPRSGRVHFADRRRHCRTQFHWSLKSIDAAGYDCCVNHQRVLIPPCHLSAFPVKIRRNRRLYSSESLLQETTNEASRFTVGVLIRETHESSVRANTTIISRYMRTTSVLLLPRTTVLSRVSKNQETDSRATGIRMISDIGVHDSAPID